MWVGESQQEHLPTGADQHGPRRPALRGSLPTVAGHTCPCGAHGAFHCPRAENKHLDPRPLAPRGQLRGSVEAGGMWVSHLQCPVSGHGHGTGSYHRGNTRDLAPRWALQGTGEDGGPRPSSWHRPGASSRWWGLRRAQGLPEPWLLCCQDGKERSPGWLQEPRVLGHPPLLPRAGNWTGNGGAGTQTGSVTGSSTCPTMSC